jgi:hypothetical protein
MVFRLALHRSWVVSSVSALQSMYLATATASLKSRQGTGDMDSPRTHFCLQYSKRMPHNYMSNESLKNSNVQVEVACELFNVDKFISHLCTLAQKQVFFHNRRQDKSFETQLCKILLSNSQLQQLIIIAVCSYKGYHIRQLHSRRMY